MNEWDILVKVMKESVERNGEKPLTNKWLLNILLLVNRHIASRSIMEDLSLGDLPDTH